MRHEQRRQNQDPEVQGAHTFTFCNASKIPLKPICFWRTSNFFLTFGYFKEGIVFVEISMIVNYTYDIMFTTLYRSMIADYIM